MLRFRIKAPRVPYIVKAERVNALRKQYDAFLEEDKKRKERNDYILGRLDNMRHNASAVQVRHKPIVIGDVMPVIPLPFHRPVYRPEPFERRDVPVQPEYQINRPTPQNLQLDLQRPYLDNTSLLREISKKYILIPKLRSSDVNDYLGPMGPQSLPPVAVSSPQPKPTSEEDWTSKYKILDQLKKKEKDTDKYGDEELLPVKEKQLSSSNIIKKSSDSVIPKKEYELYKPQEQGASYDLQSYDTKESSIKYEQEPPERDSAADKPKGENEPHGGERSKISDSKIQEPNTEQSTISSTSALNPDPDEDQETYDGYNLQSHVTNEYAPVESVPAANVYYDTSYTPTQQYEQNAEFNSHNAQQLSNDAPSHEEYPVQYEQPIVSEGKYPDKENVYLDPDDYSPIQVLDNPTAAEKTQVPASNETPGVKNVEEVTEYPVEMLNVQDFTPKEGVQLIDGVNVNPKQMASDENLDPDVYESNPQTETAEEPAVHQDSSEIEAFDAEQKEMFYSEDTVQYDHNQQQGDGYNQEYSAPQENAFYESPATVLQEQEYPAEVNEHEESNTRYDPNYEQQYGQYEQQYQEQQEYVQPEGYEQTDPQYAQQEGYDQTGQEYVQQAGYDQTGQEYVQQEGYDQTGQQYAQPAGYDQTDQQYVQQEGYDQTDPQYAQQEGYDQAGQYQNYEYEQQDQDTVQNIEQAMDNEQGYVDPQNNDANQASVADPAQQVVDQKAS